MIQRRACLEGIDINPLLEGEGCKRHGREDEGDEGEDLSKLSVSDLKERLKAKGLPVGGKKADLIARLQDGEEE